MAYELELLASGITEWVGQNFKIERKYPESEPELKTGDWVKIVGYDFLNNYRSHDPEKAYLIYSVTDSGNFHIWGIGFYPAKSLHKLTPGEVAKHLAPPINTAQNQFNEKIVAIESRLKEDRNLMMEIEERFDERQDAIEKRLENQQKKIEQFDGEIGHLNGSISECLIESGDVEARAKCRERKIEQRLNSIESRLDELGSSKADLMGDVVALAERIDAIERGAGIFPVRINMLGHGGEIISTVEENSHDALVWCRKVLEGVVP